MKSFEIVPGWHLQSELGETMHPQTLPLMLAILKFNRLTHAAQEVGMSYRHAWNILSEGESLFGQPLVLKEKGRGATLTELGHALLRFNQRMDARLHPQIESLNTELNVELKRVSADLSPVVKVFASHGFAVSQLANYAKNCQIEMHYHTPVEALLALNEGRCRVAGFHVSVGLPVTKLRESYLKLLDPEKFGILTFVRRTQGWIFAKGRDVASVKQIARDKLRFINREPKSGTRELFDQILQNENLDSTDILGYDQHEFTHSAIAAYVASNMAEVGFGVQTAAEQFNLGFSPVIKEAYLWAFPKSAQNDADICGFIETLKHTELQAKISELAGYSLDNAGDEIDLAAALSL